MSVIIPLEAFALPIMETALGHPFWVMSCLPRRSVEAPHRTATVGQFLAWTWNSWMRPLEWKTLDFYFFFSFHFFHFAFTQGNKLGRSTCCLSVGQEEGEPVGLNRHIGGWAWFSVNRSASWEGEKGKALTSLKRWQNLGWCGGNAKSVEWGSPSPGVALQKPVTLQRLVEKFLC